MTTATAPAIHVRVPLEEQFGGADFMPAPELTALYEQLITDYPETHGHLHWVEVKLAWKRKGGKKNGQNNLAFCQKLSGAAKYYADADFLIWLAADEVLAREMTDREIRACVSHEMRHVGWDVDEEGNGKAVILGHDVELFFSEVREIGGWNEMLREAASAFEQAPLFGE
jgi:hypothetical protein